MVNQDQRKKGITIRLPEDLWERAAIAAIRQRTSVQEAAVKGLCLVLDLDLPLKQAAPTETSAA